MTCIKHTNTILYINLKFTLQRLVHLRFAWLMAHYKYDFLPETGTQAISDKVFAC